MEEKIKFEDHDLNEPVNFTVFNEKEACLGSKKTPAIKLGMRCTNKNGQEFDEWVNYVLWGTINGNYFTQLFLNNIDKNIKIEWDGDCWSGYNPSEKPFKFAKGQCTVTAKVSKGKTYYNMDQIVTINKENQEENQPVAEEKTTTITDADIPF